MIWLFTAREDGGMEFAPQTKVKLFSHLKAHAGKRYAIVFEEPKRTIAQNSYFHFYLHLVSQETGNGETMLKEHWINEHAPLVEDMWKGKPIMRRKRTHEMTKLEMSEFMDKCAAESEIPLPDPTDAGYFVEYVTKSKPWTR